MNLNNQGYHNDYLKRKLFLFSLLLIFWTSLHSQSYEAGLSAGGSFYFGDLDAPSFIDNVGNAKLSFGAFFRFNYNSNLNFRLNFLVGKIDGSDSNSDNTLQLERNLSFVSNITEIAGLVEINFFDIISKSAFHRWTPYVVGGVALLHHNPKTLYQGELIELQPLGTEAQGSAGYPEKYSLNLVTVPLGAGIKYQLNPKIHLQFEILGRLTFFDYLDDVSTIYINYFELLNTNGFLAATLSNRTGEYFGQSEPVIVNTGTPRGNPDINDFYYSAMFSLYINLGRQRYGVRSSDMGCPTF